MLLSLWTDGSHLS